MKNTITMKENIPTLEVNDPMMLSEYAIIDVRTEHEFNAELGHIDGAKRVTLGEELDHFLKNQDKNKKILFICRSGARSGKATLQALELGYNNVFNMEGGMLLWNDKQFPVKRES